jgi:hypothetical protein
LWFVFRRIECYVLRSPLILDLLGTAGTPNMAQIRHLRNAPILEAIMDFRAALPKSFDVTQFKALAPMVGARYPFLEPMHKYETSLTFQPGQAPRS